MLLTLPRALSLPVARGLIALILHMDFTCNIDMFLLACKVLARIIWCSRPALPLGDVMANDQLLKLVRMAVWQDPHESSWGGPWAAHAITCLLQDILDGVRSAPAPTLTSSREGSPSEESNESRQPASSQRASFEKPRGSSGTACLKSHAARSFATRLEIFRRSVQGADTTLPSAPPHAAVNIEIPICLRNRIGK